MRDIVLKGLKVQHKHSTAASREMGSPANILENYRSEHCCNAHSKVLQMNPLFEGIGSPPFDSKRVCFKH